MTKKLGLCILLLAFTFSLSAFNIKLASPLPEGTEWHRALTQLANDWNEITNGRVRIRIYPGGIAGGQDDVIRKMRIGQIDMAVLTSTGIATIVPDTFVMTLPFALETEEELDFVLEEIAPTFQSQFQDKGFRMLGWSKSGWVNFFSIEKFEHPAQLKGLKLSVSPEELTMINAFKNIGFKVVPLDWNNILMGLQSGMIESFYSTPMATAAYQWFGIANQMLEMNIAPVIGGLIISERTWNRIPDQYHEELQAAMDKMTSSFFEKTQALENQAMRVMQDNGLSITATTEAHLSEWQAVVGENYSEFVGPGKMISRPVFNDFQAKLEAFRAQ